MYSIHFCAVSLVSVSVVEADGYTVDVSVGTFPLDVVLVLSVIVFRPSLVLVYCSKLVSRLVSFVDVVTTVDGMLVVVVGVIPAVADVFVVAIV